MHNLVTPHPYKWYLNPYAWDVQLRALNSWITHENETTNELIKYEVASEDSKLYIRGESTRPSKGILSHTTLIVDPAIISILRNKQEEAIWRFEQLKGEELQAALQACEDRWVGLSPKMNATELHSPSGLKKEIFREKLCVNTLKRM